MGSVEFNIHVRENAESFGQGSRKKTNKLNSANIYPSTVYEHEEL